MGRDQFLGRPVAAQDKLTVGVSSRLSAHPFRVLCGESACREGGCLSSTSSVPSVVKFFFFP